MATFPKVLALELHGHFPFSVYRSAGWKGAGNMGKLRSNGHPYLIAPHRCLSFPSTSRSSRRCTMELPPTRWPALCVQMSNPDLP